MTTATTRPAIARTRWTPGAALWFAAMVVVLFLVWTFALVRSTAFFPRRKN